jgi:hypothetical protein
MRILPNINGYSKWVDYVVHDGAIYESFWIVTSQLFINGWSNSWVDFLWK